MTESKKTVLFLCTGNSCRSQMAEGWCRYVHGEQIIVFSAGIEKHGLNPLALQAMQEAGVDISDHFSKLVDELPCQSFDLIVTVCGHADANCPRFPGSGRIFHQPFADPPQLAASLEDEEEIMECYRRVRDEIFRFIQELPRLFSD